MSACIQLLAHQTNPLGQVACASSRSPALPCKNTAWSAFHSGVQLPKHPKQLARSQKALRY
jgi:hypothetical protein